MKAAIAIVIVLGIVAYVVWSNRGPSNLKDLGFDLSDPSGFHGLPWGAPPERIVKDMGEPMKAEEQNGVTTYWYSVRNAMGFPGARNYVFWDGGLIGGEYASFEVPPRHEKAVMETNILGISEYLNQAAEDFRPGVIRWFDPDNDTTYMFHVHHEPATTYAFTVMRLSTLSKFLRLTRYGPSLGEVERLETEAREQGFIE